MSEPMTVLVTGAAGHLGSHLVPALLDDGFKVRGLDMAEPSAPLPREYELFRGDLSDCEVLEAAMADVDLIAHTASLHP